MPPGLKRGTPIPTHIRGVQPPASGTATKFDSTVGYQWADQLTQFVQDMAKLGNGTVSGPQTFTGFNVFTTGGAIQFGQVTLPPGDFSYTVNINRVSQNSISRQGFGGNAALYIQHLVDNSPSSVSTANVGLRCQLETYQTNAAGNVTNDCVAGYFGLYNGGVQTGGFGYHVDAVHAATGVCSTYGGSAEMYRTSAAGFTVGFHARSIGGTGKLNNDYAFLASGPGTFTSAFAAGSAQAGSLNCQYGLDMRQCNASVAQVYLLTSYPIAWGDDLGNIHAKIQYSSDTFIEFSFGGTPVFSVFPTGSPIWAHSAITTSASSTILGYLEAYADFGAGAVLCKIALLAP